MNGQNARRDDSQVFMIPSQAMMVPGQQPMMGAGQQMRMQGGPPMMNQGGPPIMQGSPNYMPGQQNYSMGQPMYQQQPIQMPPPYVTMQGGLSPNSQPGMYFNQQQQPNAQNQDPALNSFGINAQPTQQVGVNKPV